MIVRAAAVITCMDVARASAWSSVAAAAVTLILALALAPAGSPEVSGLGTVARGSIVRLGPSDVRLRLEHPFAIDRGWPAGEAIEVAVVGELPDTVCDGTRVYVVGMRTEDGLTATVVQADPGKYDRCFRWHCHPEAYAACRGPEPYYK